jgi:O-succinylbenzoate synthase
MNPVRFDRLDVYHVAMPLLYPWRTSYGEDWSIHSVLVRGTDGATTAWSESSPLERPMYLTEGAATAYRNIVQFFGPQLIGKELESAEALNESLSAYKGNQFAKAGLEILWWTMQSKKTGDPLHRLLGGNSREVAAGADFGIQDSFDMLLGNIQDAVDRGFPRVKLKFGRGWDVEMVSAVRGTFPDLRIHIDCNSGFELEDLEMFKKLDSFQLEFIEQPLGHDDLLDHAELASSIQTPICLDESITGPRKAEQALQIGACQYMNIKPGRVGGLSNAVRIHDICAEEGVPVWVGGMLESALGGAICIELATLPNFTYPGDLFPSSRFYDRDLSQPENELTDRLTFAPFVHGLPVPDPDLLAQYTIEHETVDAR